MLLKTVLKQKRTTAGIRSLIFKIILSLSLDVVRISSMTTKYLKMNLRRS